MNSAAERARGAAAAWPLPEPARWPARPPGRPVSTPSPDPRPAPLAPRRWQPPHVLELAGAPEHGENALLPGCPASPGRPLLEDTPAPSAPWPALTCSLAQPQRLAVGSPRSLARRPGRDGRGARGHESSEGLTLSSRPCSPQVMAPLLRTHRRAVSDALPVPGSGTPGQSLPLPRLQLLNTESGTAMPQLLGVVLSLLTSFCQTHHLISKN
ncbi:serine/arginine repetitive matrix protein 1-like [Nycticebus coucang]|uniref:serine/arginine repetitive matrix protein 1-like n=1 Tax=Nycticebus coucang TaxID=9470 RepID=UPI00234CF315|nr:serine/arginine repetitive matrix protein 1-like [Nycticebus coucang]